METYGDDDDDDDDTDDATENRFILTETNGALQIFLFLLCLLLPYCQLYEMIP